MRPNGGLERFREAGDKSLSQLHDCLLAAATTLIEACILLSVLYVYLYSVNRPACTCTVSLMDFIVCRSMAILDTNSSTANFQALRKRLGIALSPSTLPNRSACNVFTLVVLSQRFCMQCPNSIVAALLLKSCLKRGLEQVSKQPSYTD